MLKNLDIRKILRIMLLLLPLVLVLASCSPNEENATTEQAAVHKNADADAISASHRECWQSKIVDDLYDTLGKAALEMYTKITSGALAMMMTAFAVWFSFRLLKHLGSVMEENAAEVWTEVGRKFFLCFTLGLLASQPYYIIWFLNIAVFPIYNTFLEYGSEILTSAAANVKDGGSLQVMGESYNWEMSKLICKYIPQTGAAIKETATTFPEEPKKMMQCLICAVNDRMTLGTKLSVVIMKGNGFMVTVVGVLMWACFMFVKLGFVFYIVDSVFKFAVVAVILPLLIMSYAFDYTRDWMKFGFKTIISSAAFMMFIAVMITMALLATEEVIRSNPEIFAPAGTERDFKDISIPVMCLLLICFLIISSTKVAQQVTGSLVGTVDTNFQKKLQTVVMTISKWIVGVISFGFGAGAIKTYEIGKKTVKEGIGKIKGGGKGKAGGMSEGSKAMKVISGAAKAAKTVNDAADRVSGNKEL